MKKQWLCTSVAMGMAVLTACGGGASSNKSVAEQSTVEQTAEQETKEEAIENADAETYIKQGDAAYDANDYDKALECYYHAAKLSVENSDESFWKSDAYNSMLESFDESKDQNKVYEYAKELYQLKPSESGCLKSFLWGASLLGTEEAKEEVKEAVTGQIQEKWVMALLNARDALKQGDLEKAKSILFVAENVDGWFDDRDADTMQVYFGYPDGSDGTMRMVGMEYIFREPGAMIGQMKDKKWEGECIAWIGEEDTTYTGRDNAGMTDKYDRYYTGTWSDGLPEGTLLYQSEMTTTETGKTEAENRTTEEGEIVCSKGLAQGHTEVKVYEDYDGSLEWESTVIHEYKDGLPQAFSANTEDGTKTVYEYITFPDDDEVYDYSEDDCGDELIWN